LRIRVLRNEDVRRVVAFIPKGHRHVRMLIEIDGEILILQQATVDALIRAYSQVALHPRKKALELVRKELRKDEKKEGFAKWQLLESSRDEDEVLDEAIKLYYQGTHTKDI
jgi:hypothetical protein